MRARRVNTFFYLFVEKYILLCFCGMILSAFMQPKTVRNVKVSPEIHARVLAYAKANGMKIYLAVEKLLKLGMAK